MKKPETFLEVVPGYKYQLKRPMVSNEVIHIIAIFGDDKKYADVLYKWYSRKKCYWQFCLTNLYFLKSMHERGKFNYIGKSEVIEIMLIPNETQVTMKHARSGQPKLIITGEENGYP